MKFIEILTGSTDGGPILSFVGGVWVDHSCTLKPTFMTVAEEIYKTKAESVDFQSKAIEITEEVNKLMGRRGNKWTHQVCYTQSFDSGYGICARKCTLFQRKMEGTL
ncbi:hypothetical protein IFM89_031559 [Coptis chinensis]|uniref:Serpin domain-containing protein n=1 Tax=Coptis chinensis TaxID=261450 RepID=A0A835HNL1_9MAGN|nr:hypothetical protein IFM89_031559 [Coptis chinensis]